MSGRILCKPCLEKVWLPRYRADKTKPPTVSDEERAMFRTRNKFREEQDAVYWSSNRQTIADNRQAIADTVPAIADTVMAVADTGGATGDRLNDLEQRMSALEVKIANIEMLLAGVIDMQTASTVPLEGNVYTGPLQ